MTLWDYLDRHPGMAFIGAFVLASMVLATIENVARILGRGRDR